MRFAFRNRTNTIYGPGSEINLNLQLFCVESLVEIGSEAYGPLLEASREGDIEVRMSMPGILAAKWGAAAMPHLLELLEDKDEHFRASAAEALGELKDKRAGDALFRHVRDFSEKVRLVAAEALVQIGDPRGFGSLLQLLEDSKRSCISASAALGRLKDKRATDALILHLGNSDRDVRSSAAKALCEIGDPKAIPALLKALKDQNILPVDDPDSLAGALARIGREEGRQYLLAELKSPDLIKRRVAIDAMRKNEIQGTLDALLPLLSDEEELVRLSAFDALGELQEPRAVPAFKKLLKDPHSYVRILAVELLGKTHDPGVVPNIKELLNDPAPNVRQSAADALEELAEPPPASPVRAAQTSHPGKP